MRRPDISLAARPVLVCTPTFARMWDTWVSTVFSLMNKRVAICRLVQPSATSVAISCSRSVREESPTAAAGRFRTRRPSRRNSAAASRRKPSAPVAVRSASARLS